MQVGREEGFSASNNGVTYKNKRRNLAEKRLASGKLIIEVIA